ncbi:MAG: tyrosine-type recombinase/integrase [Verrucomicrobiota bacterium]|jgi:integrase
MKQRYILFKRAGVFYSEDTSTRKQISLRTKDEGEAVIFLNAKNEAARHSEMNLQIAQVYLQHSDPSLSARTWQDVMEKIISLKSGSTRERWGYAINDKAFDLIRHRKLLETTSEHFLTVLNSGSVATNVYLRRAHNFAIGMHWLPWPVLPKLQWPPVRFKEKRAITSDEHARIVDRERNSELRAFYELLWHLGGSQSDVANLTAKDIHWQDRTISFQRCKTKVPVVITFGAEAAAILETLPKFGLLFPWLSGLHEKHRAKHFIKRLATVGITGISLHSYRYAWAERAKVAGMPERFAQQALGHSSKAFARAYSSKAKVIVPSLEEYERKIVPMRAAVAMAN